jgi:hypothetical protein
MKRRFLLLLVVLLSSLFASCGSGSSSLSKITSVTVSPSITTLEIEQNQQFTVEVKGTGDFNASVNWYVNDIQGGNATFGTISWTGVYIAPSVVPEPATVTIKAVSVQDSTKFGTASVTITGLSQPKLLWTTYFEGLGYGGLSGVLTDEDQNVIAAGTTYDDSITGTQRAVVLSTDKSGRKRWIYTSDGPADARDIVLALDLKSVFVVGILGNYPEQLPLLFAVNSAGSKVLESVCSTMTGSAIVDAAGDYSRIYLALWSDSFILTSDLTGALDCTNTIPAAVSDLSESYISAVSPMDDGLVVAGYRRMTNECWKGAYPFVQKITFSGQLEWRFDFESTIGPRGSALNAPKVAVADETGQTVLYLTCSISTPRGEDCLPLTPNDLGRYMTAKLDGNGNLKWVNLWDGDIVPACEAYPSDILVDPRGGVVIVGYSSGTNCSPYVGGVASYDSDGFLRWTMKPTFKGTDTLCKSATISSDGRFLYLVGMTFPDLFVAGYALPQ